MGLKTTWQLVKNTVQEWSEDQAPRYSAALAFYTMFSIAPLLFLVIGIAGLVFGKQAAEGQLAGQLSSTFGTQAAKMLQDAIHNVSKGQTDIWASIVGLAILLVGASSVFAELQYDLNTMWDVKPKPKQGILTFIRTRVLSFGMVLVIGLLLLISLVVSSALTMAGTFLTGLAPGVEILMQILNFILGLAVITLLFAAIYKYLPDADIQWNDVWVGAFVTALLFSIGRYAIGLYLGKATVASSFGAAGALVIVLLWVYYSAQILFFGAEFTQVRAKMRGRGIPPAPHAMKTE